ncbi:MAG TPA: helix-turn-helix transcriptional regulator [Candidatus Acidoferrales bacterium]|nr:helix-turn-helix transcriptional regulator [Candidatus Acidoferrales bacterium]
MKIIDAANELNHQYAPHLQVRELYLASGKEWTPVLCGWSLVQIGSGSGYWLEEQSRLELATGTVLLLCGNSCGRVLASRLTGLSLRYFSVMPDRLTGLITQGEQDLLKQAAGRREMACQLLPPMHPVAVKLRDLCDGSPRDGLLFRLLLLQLAIEALGKALEQPASSQLQTDVRERLRVFLSETPPAALLEITFEELAGITHCTPRHLSRVFYDLVGMSFREKRAEIRLARARELLATSESKVVDVAFKSGYKSLSLFNRMFTRRFGISPGRWRQKNSDVKATAHRRNGRLRLAAIWSH